MLRLYFIIFFYITGQLQSQVLSGKQELIVKQTIYSQFGEVANNTLLNTGKASFCITGEDTLFTPCGYNYVFKIQSDTLKRLDHSLFHGANGRRFLFSWKNIMHALGGYGFFTTNNNLIYFNRTIGEWSFAPVSGDVPLHVLGLTFKNGKYLYSFNNFKSGNNAGPDVMDSSAYILNLESMLWCRYNHPDISAIITGEAYYTNDYCFLQGRSRSWLIKPSDMSYLILNNEELGFQPRSFISAVNENILTVNRFKNGNDVYTITLNLDETWKRKLPETKKLVFKAKEVSEGGTIRMVAFAAGIILMMGIGGMLLYRKSRSFKSPPRGLVEEALIIPEENGLQSNEDGSRFIAILKSSKTLLTTEELDELLNITYLEGDSRKLRRHRLLSELQKEYPGVITRIKDESDKRRFFYKISILKNEGLV